ncbi:MAG TPA: Ig-like domain-containing protein [Thiolinea sp.]|nr:Ig-like domain-containing protein [Thiolinea sp.]
MFQRKYILYYSSLFLISLSVASTQIEAASPMNLGADIPWQSSGNSDVANISSAFNAARRSEENQLGLKNNSLGTLRMPTQTTWNGLTDDAKALYLINAERTARASSGSGVIGLPLAGIERRVDLVAQSYANVLLKNNATGHYQPSGNASVDNPVNRLDKRIKSSCREFLARSENLAYFWTASTEPVGQANIDLPIEKAIYNWIYADAGSNWGHRETALLQDETLSDQGEPYGYKNNNGSNRHEGFLGIHRIGSKNYIHPSLVSQPYHYGEVIVMNIYDSVSTSAAKQAKCGYNIMLSTDTFKPLNSNLNRAPRAFADRIRVKSGKTVRINVLNNDKDIDGQIISLNNFTKPANGTVVRTGQALKYTAPQGFSGTDTFFYRIKDTKGAKSARARVTVVVSP